jgi:hypothetical protein
MTLAISSPRLRLAVLAGTVALLFAVGPPELRVALAYIGPFLTLLGFLLSGRYPGERLIARPRRPAARRSRRAAPARAVSFAAIVPRGGRLLAFALAGRGPPALQLRSSPLQISL